MTTANYRQIILFPFGDSHYSVHTRALLQSIKVWWVRYHWMAPINSHEPQNKLQYEKQEHCCKLIRLVGSVIKSHFKKHIAWNDLIYLTRHDVLTFFLSCLKTRRVVGVIMTHLLVKSKNFCALSKRHWIRKLPIIPHVPLLSFQAPPIHIQGRLLAKDIK